MFTILYQISRQHRNTKQSPIHRWFQVLGFHPYWVKLSIFFFLISTLKNLSFLLYSLSFKFLLIPSTWLLALFVALVSCRCRCSRFSPHCTKIQYIITLRIYEVHGKCMLPLHSLEENSPRHWYVSISYHLVERTQLNTQQLFPAYETSDETSKCK